ncbi:MAG: carboxypeptidase-like regulatory domain-containing protein [Thermoplasmata archaeon]|nr:carboxypeptidase-like regulatory domain-containing protein [Thermoplasmata archaeon]
MVSPTPVTLRCPRCGKFLSTLPPVGPGLLWTHCPSCSYPVPVIHPRDPSPLFTWEVYPEVAPVGTLPEWSGPTARRFSSGLLLFATAVLVLVGLLAVVTGLGALPSHTYTVGGTVESAVGGAGSSAPVPGAQVVVTGENGFRVSVFTGSDGSFSVSNVPSGAIGVNVTAAGYAPAQEELFDSPVYAAPSGGARGITVNLAAAGSSGGSFIQLSAFPSLESLVATLWSGAILFVIAATVCIVGGLRDLRTDRPAWGVAGGASAALAGFLLPDLGLTTIIPEGLLLASIGATCGVLAFATSAFRLAARSPPVGPSEDGL